LADAKKAYKRAAWKQRKCTWLRVPISAAMGVETTTPGHSWLGRFIPYFKNEENVLRAKLDCFLLLWMFIAGIMKEMDQSATTQAYVSGMKEDLALFGNELNWFQTYFSIAYAIFIVPSQMLQTKLRPSLWLPFAEIAWGVLTLLYVF
jgi:ACS family pantothenate transporter-like MFS transporter